MMKYISIICYLLFILWKTNCKCAFLINETGFPQQTDRDPFIIEGMDQCKQYNGQYGCCDSGNNIQQVTSYVQINGIFGHLGGGCDICAINLKRFWCEYACSPNQSDFVSAAKQYISIPDPQKPDQEIEVQRVNVTVNAETACKLYDSCKRNPFVAAVSAMSTPAGFLTFQGHNAPDQSHQQLIFSFSYDKQKSLTLSNERKQKSSKALDICNFTTSEKTIHGYEFSENCTCNSCQESCHSDSGFIYEDTTILEGFNYLLVSIVCFGSIIISTVITLYRKKYSNQKMLLKSHSQ